MEMKELLTKSEDQLRKDLSELREEAAGLSARVRLQQAKNSHKLLSDRRDIARILTVLRQKEGAK